MARADICATKVECFSTRLQGLRLNRMFRTKHFSRHIVIRLTHIQSGIEVEIRYLRTPVNPNRTHAVEAAWARTWTGCPSNSRKASSIQWDKARHAFARRLPLRSESRRARTSSRRVARCS